MRPFVSYVQMFTKTTLIIVLKTPIPIYYQTNCAAFVLVKFVWIRRKSAKGGNLSSFHVHVRDIQFLILFISEVKGNMKSEDILGWSNNQIYWLTRSNYKRCNAESIYHSMKWTSRVRRKKATRMAGIELPGMLATVRSLFLLLWFTAAVIIRSRYNPQKPPPPPPPPLSLHMQCC